MLKPKGIPRGMLVPKGMHSPSIPGMEPRIKKVPLKGLFYKKRKK